MNTYSVVDQETGWSVAVEDGSGLPERYGHFQTEEEAQMEAERLTSFEATLLG
jgi:hypothetical protein